MAVGIKPTIMSGSGLVIAYFLRYLVAYQLLIVVFEELVLRERFTGAYDECCGYQCAEKVDNSQ